MLSCAFLPLLRRRACCLQLEVEIVAGAVAEAVAEAGAWQ